MVSAQEDREIVDFLGSFSLLKEICDDDPIELAKLCLTDDSAIQIASKCFSAYHAIKEREHLNPSARPDDLAATGIDRGKARAEAAKRTVFASGCSSWYLDKDGVPQVWPWSYDYFREVMAKPDLRDYELTQG